MNDDGKIAAMQACFTLFPDEVARIGELAKTTRASKSAIVRELIPSDTVLRIYKKMRKKHPGLGYRHWIESMVCEWHKLDCTMPVPRPFTS